MNQMTEPTKELVSKDQKATSLWTLGCPELIIPVVIFLTSLAKNFLIQKDRYAMLSWSVFALEIKIKRTFALLLYERFPSSLN
ncbi:unnamed protein product [Gongylonema pulchrum]|uniref:Uncharacterized protein n=1 Tax=Gongylonema pulchrum TaxID=637853 RepID=A0A183D0S8_9BILA|nr:unnamed protein product [Gongylonema pulchrum]